MKFYLDSSFIIDVIKEEPKALAIVSNLDGSLCTSQLGRLEVLRTFNRFYYEWLPNAYEFLEILDFIDLDDIVLSNVVKYGPSITLTTADAIHVSTAQLTLEEEDALVTFDKLMAKNAKLLGLNVIAA